MSTLRSIRTMILVGSGLFASLSVWSDMAVIVNSAYPVSSADNDAIAKVFLSKANALSGGGTLIPVDQSDSSPLRKDFYSKLANKNPAQMNAYWSKLIFTGQGQPPKAVGGDAEVVSLVAANPSMIGYVHAAAVHKGVKVIAKVPE